ncbi:hypothetical protein ACH4UM_36655 [Streptomyces sp. NPDC020801]|uniref:hypothetical protein n=1 Tax=unclassified Streptomyces TaxID=2593676 RepID=UPI00378FA98D
MAGVVTVHRRGDVRPLLLDLDPRRSAYSDYTRWDWFALPRDTGLRPGSDGQRVGPAPSAA